MKKSLLERFQTYIKAHSITINFFKIQWNRDLYIGNIQNLSLRDLSTTDGLLVILIFKEIFFLINFIAFSFFLYIFSNKLFKILCFFNTFLSSKILENSVEALSSSFTGIFSRIWGDCSCCRLLKSAINVTSSWKVHTSTFDPPLKIQRKIRGFFFGKLKDHFSSFCWEILGRE